MIKSCILVLSLLFVLPAGAQIYEWRDAQGRLNYADQPPPGVDARLVRPARTPSADDSGSGEPAAELTTQEKAQAMREQREAAQGERLSVEEERARAAEVERACAQARNQLVALESGQRVSRFNAEGQREFLDDEARKGEIDRAKSFIDSRCN